MKTNNIFRNVGLVVAAIAAVTLTSCKDEPDKYKVTDGTPSVNYVRLLSSEIVGTNDAPDTHYTNGELVEEASPQSIVCLVGENLRSVVELFFNDKKAVLNSSFITDNSLIVQIPRNVPDLVSDKIFMVTSSGDTIGYDFHVDIPAPTVTSMSFEYAQAGTKAALYGSYFVDDPNVPLTITFPNGSEATDIEVDDTRSTVSFTVPECAEAGPLSVTSIYGTTKTAFYYKDNRGLLFDFDGKTGLGNHGWHNREIKSDETSYDGNFVQLGDGTALMSTAGGWDDNNFAFEYWCGSWDTPQNITSGDGIALFNLVDFSKWENMALKFDMYVPKDNPWQAGAMQIAFQGVDQVTLSGNPIEGFSSVAGANAKIFNGDDGMGVYGRAMYRPWTSTGSYDTGNEWKTVTVPLTNFTYDREGKTATKTFSSDKDFGSLTIFVVGGGVNGTECKPIIKIDNIRVVPNK